MKEVIMLYCMLTAFAAQGLGFEQDRFKTPEGKDLVITFVKHGSLMLEYDGHVLLVDPVSDYADYSKFPKADLILITHEHHDHLDSKAIAATEKESTLIIVNPASQEKLGKGIAMKNGDRRSPVSYLNIEAVPAYNTTPGRDQFHPRGRDNGYILTLGGMRVYIAGDTEDIPEMKQLKNIDIAFLPVNQPYTMTPVQAAHAAEMIKPRILYPYHYGETKIQDLKDLLKKDKHIDVRIRQLQ